MSFLSWLTGSDDDEQVNCWYRADVLGEPAHTEDGGTRYVLWDYDKAPGGAWGERYTSYPRGSR
jgi:hypothetical protein